MSDTSMLILGSRKRANATKRRRTLGSKISSVLVRVPLLVWSLIVIYPIIWMFLGAFKTNGEIFRSPWSLPESFSFDSFVRAWTEYGVGTGLLNSAVVTILGTALTLIVGLPAAYAIGRVKFFGAKFLYGLFVVSLSIPMVLGLIPLFFLLLDTNLLNNHLALAVIYAGTRMAFTIFLLSGFMHTIPKEVEEAAALDGLSRLRMLGTIVAPMMGPALITVAVMNAVTFWNEYVMALLFMPREESRTIGVVLSYMNTNAQYTNDWGGLFAALALSVVPVIIVYAVLQKQIVQGMIDGAVKD